MTKKCLYQKSKLINLYNRLEKILSDKASEDLALADLALADLASADLALADLALADLALADLASADLENRPTRTNMFVPIEVHNDLILDICFIEDNYLCFDTEKCKHCKKINNRRFRATRIINAVTKTI